MADRQKESIKKKDKNLRRKGKVPTHHHAKSQILNHLAVEGIQPSNDEKYIGCSRRYERWDPGALYDTDQRVKEWMIDTQKAMIMGLKERVSHPDQSQLQALPYVTPPPTPGMVRGIGGVLV